MGYQIRRKSINKLHSFSQLRAYNQKQRYAYRNVYRILYNMAIQIEAFPSMAVSHKVTMCNRI